MIDINKMRLLVQDYKLAGSPVFVQAAEKERDWNAERLEYAIEELKALRAKIEAAKKQKPVMWANSSNIISTRIWPARGSVGYQHTCSETKTAYHGAPLYLAPGAKGEEK